MKGSLKIIKLFNVPVKLHWSFLLLLVGGAYYGFKHALASHEMLWWSLFGLAVFSSILLHEFGHVLAARRVGVQTKDIVLLPIGGLARLDKLPEKPLHELFVAVAGPLVNIGIAAVLLPFFWIYTKPALVEHSIPTAGNLTDDYFFFLPLLLFLNLLLAVFNMIPAFPMDGGRILRALLSIRWGRLRATQIAMSIGQVIAIGLVVAGTWYGKYSYALIGVFISYTAAREYRWIKTEHLLESLLVGDAMKEGYGRLVLTAAIEVAARSFEEQGPRQFFVFDEMGVVVGTYFYNEMENGTQATVSEVYRPCTARLNASDNLKLANERLASSPDGFLPVYKNGALAGILDDALLWDFVAQQAKA